MLIQEILEIKGHAVCTIGPHTIRLRPSAEMPVAAAVALAADVEAPRSVTALGMQFDVEPVEAAVLANPPH